VTIYAVDDSIGSAPMISRHGPSGRELEMIDFQRQEAEISPGTGEELHTTVNFIFPTNVQRAEIVLAGFDIQFTDKDRSFYQMMINPLFSRNYPAQGTKPLLNVTWVGGVVTAKVYIGLRDYSGYMDDQFKGYLDLLAIVERVG
jgi:hypothetical protein